MLPFCRFSLYFIHIILLTWTRIQLFWRMIEIFIQSPGTEIEFLTFCVIIMITFNKYIAEWMQNMGKICETSHCQEIFYKICLLYCTCIYAFFSRVPQLPWHSTFLGQLKCHLYFFASRQVDNSICLNIVLTLCLWNMNIKIKLLKWSTLWRKNKFRACTVESTREDYSLVESLCQGGGMTQHFLEHLPFYTLSDTVKKLIGLQY